MRGLVRSDRSHRLCKHCGSKEHSSMACFKAPRKIIKGISDKARNSKSATQRQWHKHNPPDENGQWQCYLQIAEECPRMLTYEYLVYEHVVPRVKAPELRFVHTNIRPACMWCNTLKGSQTLEQLAIIYPHLKALIQ